MEKGSKGERIANDLRKQIESGELGPGSKLPSERTLAETYDAARVTARNGIRILENEGLVEALHGKGVFVREKRSLIRHSGDRYNSSHWKAGLSPFHAEVKLQGKHPWVEVPSIDVVSNRVDLLDLLELDHSVDLVERTNHYFADDEPVQIGLTYIPIELALGTPLMTRDPGPGSIYARFDELGHKLTKVREQISSRMPSNQESETLKIPPATPLIELTHVGIDQDNKPFEITIFKFPADRHTITYELTVN